MPVAGGRGIGGLALGISGGEARDGQESQGAEGAEGTVREEEETREH